MKPRLFFLLMLVASSMTMLASCKNCYACKKSFSKNVVCRDEYNNAQEFEYTLTSYRNSGYVCE